MSARQLALDDAIASHEAVFDLRDLTECLDKEILDALRDGDECAAGHVLARNMKQLIAARAAYGMNDD